MDQWLADLETLPERAAEKFPRMLGRGGMNIKGDWKKLWQAASHIKGHIPHLIRGVGYDVHEKSTSWDVEVGVDPKNRQAFLSKIISFGTLTSAPHDAGQTALDAEDPRYVQNVADLAVKLLDGT